MEVYDYIVIGAGITGLTIAYELRRLDKQVSILILEKEKSTGVHASGRNSGVLHSGVYYEEDSIKAKICSEGAALMANFCVKQKLPLYRIGKLILPVSEEDDVTLGMLYQRGQKNGAKLEIIDSEQLKSIEPEAHSLTGKALHLPDVAIVEPKAVLEKLVELLRNSKVKIKFRSPLQLADVENSRIKAGDKDYGYAQLYNAGGQYADRIAYMFGTGERYTILPIKGTYYKLADNAGIRINKLIYPVPNLEMPFLGIHSVKTVSGQVYFGPTAIPAFGRENYHGIVGIELKEVSNISKNLIKMYWNNNQNFRQYARQEATRFLKSKFLYAAKRLVPKIEAKHLLACAKVGIRAQLFDNEKSEMKTDFIIERKDNTTHVLNAISPAFTCAFSFAKMIIKPI